MRNFKLIITISIIIATFSLKAESRKDTTLFYTFDAGSQVKKIIARTINQYDENNNLTEFLTQNWNTANSTWINYSKNVFK